MSCQAAIILSASVTFMSFPGLDNIARLAGFVAILCSAASMSASVIALFRYKADMERTVWHYDMAGSGIMLTVCLLVVLVVTGDSSLINCRGEAFSCRYHLCSWPIRWPVSSHPSWYTHSEGHQSRPQATLCNMTTT